MPVSLQRKILATVWAAVFFAVVQLFILWRTRPPQPPRIFPKISELPVPGSPASH